MYTLSFSQLLKLRLKQVTVSALAIQIAQTLFQIARTLFTQAFAKIITGHVPSSSTHALSPPPSYTPHVTLARHGVPVSGRHGPTNQRSTNKGFVSSVVSIVPLSMAPLRGTMDRASDPQRREPRRCTAHFLAEACAVENHVAQAPHRGMLSGCRGTRAHAPS